jgi:hypothetical protein
LSDLSDLAEDVAKDMPHSVRKVIDTATANGWQLNRPGVTIALRLNHPTDTLADPVYVTWVVGRTKSGKLSFRFGSCSTRGLVPLKGSDLLEYLADPTVAYMTPDEAEELDRNRRLRELDKVKWDKSEDPVTNAAKMLGASVIAISRPPRSTAKPKASAPPPLSGATVPLRISAPKA